MALSWEKLIVCYGLSRTTHNLSYLYDNRVSDVTVSVLGHSNGEFTYHSTYEFAHHCSCELVHYSSCEFIHHSCPGLLTHLYVIQMSVTCGVLHDYLHVPMVPP